MTKSPHPWAVVLLMALAPAPVAVAQTPLRPPARLSRTLQARPFQARSLAGTCRPATTSTSLAALRPAGVNRITRPGVTGGPRLRPVPQASPRRSLAVTAAPGDEAPQAAEASGPQEAHALDPAFAAVSRSDPRVQDALVHVAELFRHRSDPPEIESLHLKEDESGPVVGMRMRLRWDDIAAGEGADGSVAVIRRTASLWVEVAQGQIQTWRAWELPAGTGGAVQAE